MFQLVYKIVVKQSVYSVLLLLCFSCKQASPPLFTLEENSGIDFVNKVVDDKVENSFLFRNFYNGGGVAIGDINNDSLPDVFLTSNQGENKLYLNKGNLKFEDISQKAQLHQDSMWSTGVTMVDINGDGWLDIYVCNSGRMQNGNRRNKLYINNHDLSFTEAASKYGLDISGYCTQASFFDYDNDGDLDCFLINNNPIPFSSLNYSSMRDSNIVQQEGNTLFSGGGNHLYRNDFIGGQSHFTEVTKETGIHNGLISFGLGVSVADMNQDNYPDIYVGNDFIEKDYLYINQGNKTFKDDLENCMQQISMSSMSSDVGDINNDGYPEIFTTDMLPEDDYRLKTTGTFDNVDLYKTKQKNGLYHQFVKNCLQLNNKNGTFSEIGNYSGVSATDWSWGALFFDADNDGLNDIYVCNGISKDVGDLDFLDFFSNQIYSKMLEEGKREEVDKIIRHIPQTPLANRVFKNEGNLQFTDMGKKWGMTQLGFSNGAAYSDLDLDGDLDLVVNNENGPAYVYRNNAREINKNSYLSIELRGKGKNTYAIGAKIKIYKGDQQYYREVIPVRGFQSSVDYRQIIGLGTISRIDSILIIWPDNTYSKYEDFPLNQSYRLEQPSSAPLYTPPDKGTGVHLKLIANSLDKHEEDEYEDFYYERNLPERLSREGPHIAVGDVNGDGLEDLYIGGAKDQAGSLYTQTAEGGYQKQEEEIFEQYKDMEDVAVHFFDADGDKDLDLYIGSGGNNVPPHSRELQHRLYKNDGHGHFSIDTEAFPPNDMNISVAVSNDYDGDGDLDLFVGSRSVPREYGTAPRSYLYQNDGHGHFTDVTEQQAPGLGTIGMVTGATWADLDGDGRKELIITGEWMYTHIYRYDGKVFTEQKHTGLESLNGWWQTIKAADINSDGNMDLIIGNIGENFYLRPDKDHPVRLWVNDFDHNGTQDQVLTRTIKEQDVPVFLKRELTDQFPGLKKENLKHSDYAKKTIRDLFDKTDLASSKKLLFNYCASVVALNTGGGHFRIVALPVEVQLSSINAVLATEINGDGNVDLITGGNMFEFPPQFGRLDASYGNLLLGDGQGGFRTVESGRSGLNLRGEIRDIVEVKGRSKTVVVVAQNNERPAMYEVNYPHRPAERILSTRGASFAKMWVK